MTEHLTGSYGFLIKPDSATNDKSIELSEQLAPDAEYKNRNAHVTLFHAKFKDLPVENIRNTLERLAEFKSSQFKLSRLQEYGGKFLFWNINKNTEIMEMHKIALDISKHFDREAAARALEEGLKLNDQEVANIQKYGYPLVNDLYLPHITIAWKSLGIVIPPDSEEVNWTMTASDIVFAEIGEYGSMKQVVNP